ncbi:helix-turn-helix domain-containing protein [Ferrimonas kyonanensis]|uniref:helix-turn-helix domain-containing protein n=1 Tax=Ferrimonas kyonanensis TaxID=364763 RepID=UPI0003F758A1|nr:LysR family transcriptional regulator [Ferrimonas kyonanensis]
MYEVKLEVKGVRVFVEVARERHVGRVAERLTFTQAAVSARIKQLEGYFDSILFVGQGGEQLNLDKGPPKGFP